MTWKSALLTWTSVHSKYTGSKMCRVSLSNTKSSRYANRLYYLPWMWILREGWAVKGLWFVTKLLDCCCWCFFLPKPSRNSIPWWNECNPVRTHKSKIKLDIIYRPSLRSSTIKILIQENCYDTATCIIRWFWLSNSADGSVIPY